MRVVASLTRSNNYHNYDWVYTAQALYGTIYTTEYQGQYQRSKHEQYNTRRKQQNSTQGEKTSKHYELLFHKHYRPPKNQTH